MIQTFRCGDTRELFDKGRCRRFAAIKVAADTPLDVACATGCKLTELTALTAQLHRLRSNIAGHLEAASS